MHFTVKQKLIPTRGRLNFWQRKMLQQIANFNFKITINVRLKSLQSYARMDTLASSALRSAILCVDTAASLHSVPLKRCSDNLELKNFSSNWGFLLWYLFLLQTVICFMFKCGTLVNYVSQVDQLTPDVVAHLCITVLYVLFIISHLVLVQGSNEFVLVNNQLLYLHNRLAGSFTIEVSNYGIMAILM